ncbi:AAA family ATPase [Comamonas sp.]|uniref:ATP-binding protein n=2 Tax=Comamonas sp. TaxID=34028 RepID=UPI00289C7744|nr:AAA family ATPase [Comamonas sp.]
MSAPTDLHFPFSAIEGQAALQQALLLLAVDPQLGGVLVEGPRGTAKSTSARALAELLPSGHFVNLPLGTTEEQLQGALDLEAALQSSAVQFRPGLLAQAHQGILYVDEVNLLPDGLVDLLLDVSASGTNRIERDGVSHQHAARIALIGTMNPEEGQLRPQLLDRFGLFVRLPNVPDVDTRKRIVRTRMAFDADPARFCAQHAQAQSQLRAQIAAARAQLPHVVWPDAVFDAVAQRCQQSGAEGVRADLVMLRAARAQAALAGHDQVSLADVQAVAELALAHRRSADAAQPPSPTGQANDPNGQQDQHQQPQRQPPNQAQTKAQTSKADAPSNNADHSQPDGWGGMAAPRHTGIEPVKALRPFTAKKA